MARPSDLIHAVSETPPPAVLGFGALQQVAVNTTLIVYPVLLASAAGLPSAKVMDLVGKPEGGVDIEASFDEFNVDLMMRYQGKPLEFPKHSPTADEIIESEDGEKLLAGFMLRSTCDRVQSSSRGGRTALLFHFEH